MMDNALQPRRTTRPNRDNIISEPLGEYPSSATRQLTNKPPRDHLEAYLSAGAGQIGGLPKVATVNAARGHSAQRTIGLPHTPNGQSKLSSPLNHLCCQTPTRWAQATKSKACSQGVDSLFW
jgi:hypothetical protein